jgi:beta-glucanase (GH16 family)
MSTALRVSPTHEILDAYRAPAVEGAHAGAQMEHTNSYRGATPLSTARAQKPPAVWHVLLCAVAAVTTLRCAQSDSSTDWPSTGDAAADGSAVAPDSSAVEGGPAVPGSEAAAPGTRAPDAGAGFDAAPDGTLGGGSADASEEGWTLIWSDEFDGPDGSAVDPNKWVHETGDNGGANSEREYYTDGTANAVVEGGNLVITAKLEPANTTDQCWYGTCLYTSARLNTSNSFTQQYGRFEARIKVPAAQGMWPAFWMLGNNIGNVGWPACGEIDILESIDTAMFAAGSLHASGYDATAQYTLAGMASFSGAFHTYGLEWSATAITFFVDDMMYETHTPADATGSGGQWPFDQPFFIILNLAVGGGWPGDPDNTTMFPQVMLVDWVRVYSKNPTGAE